MMEQMVSDRDGKVCAMDSRYCVDNGAMIAQAGALEFRHGIRTCLKETTCTQRQALREI